MNFLEKLKVTTILVGVSIAIPTLASAQEVQRLPGVIDRGVPEISAPVEKVIQSDPGQPLQEPPAAVSSTDKTEITSKLKAVAFTGNTVVSTEELQEIAAPYLNKSLTKAELAQLKFELTSAFYDRGYILVKVVTPPQDLSDGVLDVSIYEARVGEVRVENNDVVYPYVTKGISKRVKSGEVVRERDMESMVSDMNDLPNVGATLALQPGKDFGTTDLGIALREENEEINYVSLDNYGSKLTGRGVATAHVEKNNLFHAGETLGATLRATNDEFYSGQFNASVPTGFYNTIFEASYLRSDYKVGGRLEALDASGITDRMNFALSSKLLNTRNDKVTLRGGTEIRRHVSELADVVDSVDDIRQLFIESSYLHRAVNSVWYASAKLSRGFDVWGGTEKGDILSSRADGDPEALRLEPVVYANIRPIENGTVKLLATGQITDSTLLSSDLFIIGGMGSVRGFEPAQEAGESGWQFSVEYNHELPFNNNSIWRLKTGPFVDGGAVYNRVPGTVEDRQLYSVGLTLEALGDLLPQGNTKVKFDWALPVGHYESTEIEKQMFYVNLTQYF